jgi:predicted mannosyl-3-phosphoglycerate phosphatase (HAD superfamily)
MDALDVDYDLILEQAYIDHSQIIIAFDFDNTVFDYHNVGLDCSKIINILKECHDYEFPLICFTSNSGDKIHFIKGFLNAIGITKVLINDQHNFISSYIDSPITHFTKPYANIYLDDKSGLKDSYNRLNKLITKIKNKQL